MLERFVGRDKLHQDFAELRKRYFRLTGEPRAIYAVRESKRIVVQGFRDPENMNDPQKVIIFVFYLSIFI